MSATQWKVIVQAMNIVHHHANGRSDWLISEHRSVNPSREAISILSGKYKIFTFVHPVGLKILENCYRPVYIDIGLHNCNIIAARSDLLRRACT